LQAASLGTGRTLESFAMSSNLACAVLDDDKVKCWGSDNSYGGLGHGDTDARGATSNTIGDALLAVDIGTGLTARHVTVGWYHACALLTDGRVKCWGYGGDGELADGDTESRGDEPDEMGDDLPFAMVP
jgi:E3 ubiquitin-protein ligase HERC3